MSKNQVDSQKEKFERIVELVSYMVEELVDNPDSLDIKSLHLNTTGSIEISGPSREIAKIMGTRKQALHAINTIMFAVASKYGFRINLNVLNDEQRRAEIEKSLHDDSHEVTSLEG